MENKNTTEGGLKEIRMIFNNENTEWKDGKYSLFLGQQPALYDSINVNHPELFKLYKRQKATDWSEDELNLEQSRIDMDTCPAEVKDLMIENLALQWGADSIASRSIAPLFAPFITNSELWAAWLKVSEIECLTKDHEVLTTKGWLPINEVTTSTVVAQYCPEEKIIEFVNPTATISKRYKGKGYRFFNHKNYVSQVVTAKHRMLKINKFTGEVIVDEASQFDYDKGATSGTFVCPVTGVFKKEDVSVLSPIERFYIAAQADGHISNRYTGELCGTIPVWFGFSKERKIKRLFSICEEAHLEIKELTPDREIGNVKQKRNFKVNIPLKNVVDFKSFDWVDLKNKSTSWCRDFVEELRLWDGTTNKSCIMFSSKNKSVADKAQAIGTLAGMRTHKRISIDTRKDTYSDMHIVSFKDVQYVSGQCINKVEFDMDEDVFCISVPSSFFVIRHQNAVSITGNCLHALTYSEIVRQCISNPNVIFDKIMKNDDIIGRLTPISEAFRKLQLEGARYTLGLVTDIQSSYDVVMNAVVALFCLERLQFVASFAATFAVVEQGWFQAIGKLVQKIAQDERFIHAEVDKYIIKHELTTERGKIWYNKNIEFIKNIVDSVVQAEYNWNKYLFSNGRKVVGYTESLANEWVDYNAQDVYATLGFDYKKIKTNPLKYMDNWFDLNKTQNAQQEADSANYLLNVIYNDIPEEYQFEYERN